MNGDETQELPYFDAKCKEEMAELGRLCSETIASEPEAHADFLAEFHIHARAANHDRYVLRRKALDTIDAQMERVGVIETRNSPVHPDQPMPVADGDPETEAIFSRQLGSVGSVSCVQENWESPQPLGRVVRLPSWPAGVLPGWLDEWVRAEAKATQTPPDFSGMLSIAGLSTSVAKGAVVRVRQGWKEPLNVYIVVGAESGERKSAVFDDVMGPLKRHERALVERMRPVVQAREQEHRIAELALKELEKKAAVDPAARVEAASQLEILRSIQVPSLPRLFADDITPEALGTVMVEQGGRIAVLAPEGQLFEILSGLYSGKNQTNNFDVLLKGHAGEDLRVDRRNRPPEFVEKAAVTLGLTVQPYKIDNLANVPGATESGLIPRMLFSLPASMLGWRNVTPPPMPEVIAARYSARMTAIAERFDRARESGQVVELTIDSAALDLFVTFHVEIERELRDDGRLRPISAWGSKLPGAVARLAGLLAIAENEHATTIGQDQIQGAITLGRYLIEHALAVHDRAGADRVTAAALRSLRFLRAKQGAGFSARDFYRDMSLDATSAAPVLELLCDSHYIRKLPPPVPGPQGGRRPSERFEVNPNFSGQN